MDGKDIQDLIKATIETHVISALNSVPEAINKLVKCALEKPVDKNGKFDGYGANMPYLDYLVGEEIRYAARAAVSKVIQEKTADIEAEVRKGLSSDSVVAAITKSFVDSAKDDWRINVRFEKEKD